jgi:hypothetical protein
MSTPLKHKFRRGTIQEANSYEGLWQAWPQRKGTQKYVVTHYVTFGHNVVSTADNSKKSMVFEAKVSESESDDDLVLGDVA